MRKRIAIPAAQNDAVRLTIAASTSSPTRSTPSPVTRIPVASATAKSIAPTIAARISAASV